MLQPWYQKPAQSLVNNNNKLIIKMTDIDMQ